MREALDHWEFVFAAYAIGLGGLAILTLWSWRSMRSAEARRDEVKRR
ncbi:MAG: heme exporter protein CcmD [Pseudomonadota bacterium]